MDLHSYPAMAGLAYLDYLIGENEGCRQWLEKAQSIKPDWYETNMVFGMLYNRLGQFDRAVESLEKTIQATPEYYKAHFQLALAYRRLGNEAKANEHTQIYEKLVAVEKARQLQDMAQ
jgi:Tfp pilus assembly protein PilF